MAKKKEKKQRTEYIYGITSSSVSQIILNIDESNGSFTFGNDMKNIYSETTYDRENKDPKIIARTPQSNRSLTTDQNIAIYKDFDLLLSVDTNTEKIKSKNVSVVGVVIIGLDKLSEFEIYCDFRVPFCLEYIEVVSEPENFGWWAALGALKDLGYLDKSGRIGVIVDSDLGNINKYNSRELPIYDNFFLPKEVNLIYASSDVGKEIIANKALAVADSVARQCISAIKTGVIPFNEQKSENRWAEGFRLIEVTIKQPR